MIKGIIFDFNGVILWDAHLHEEAWSWLAEKLRGTPFTQEELFEKMHGVPNRIVIEYILGRQITEGEFENFSGQKEVKYRDLCLRNPDEFCLSKGAEELFDYLKENDIPHTIATASPKQNLDFFREHLHLDRWFDPTKIVYDNGTYSSKDKMFEQAARNLSLLPSECVLIEDSKSGILAGKKAGIGKIIAFGPKENHQSLLNLEGVEIAITDLSVSPSSFFA